MEALCPTCSRPNPETADGCAHCGAVFATSASHDAYDWSRGGGAVPLGDPGALGAPAPHAATQQQTATYPGAAAPAHWHTGPQRPGGVTYAAIVLFVYAGILATWGVITLVILSVVSAFAAGGPAEFYSLGVILLLTSVAAIAAGVGLMKGRGWGRVLGLGIHALVVVTGTGLFTSALGLGSIVLAPTMVFALPSLVAVILLFTEATRRWFDAGAPA